MAVDSRYKRASATSVAQPTMTNIHTDGTNAVDTDERVWAGWMYMGIAVGAAVPAKKKGLLLGVY